MYIYFLLVNFMKNKCKIIFLLATLISCNNTNKEKKRTVDSLNLIKEESFLKEDEVINYLNATNEISFNGTTYKLAWTAFNGENYYKQEYIPEDNKIEAYEEMIFIDYIMENSRAEVIVNEKIKEINNRKQTDPIANYQLIYNEKKKEYLLDFSLSQVNNNNQVSIVEWNAYRVQDDIANKAVLIYALSKRSYRANTRAFLKKIKANKTKVIQEFIALPMPTIVLD